ncbi:DUF4166 domain-containing protein [Microvirga sp. CF3062]|uniref:DUF4166 domain-containing protein n=1 Tax=Microvirga sp. CF3062 TaxID=3110182 RepID=UPI002E75FC03|nr:DUF4166 domain-containing protein [Microvirga sp. CF3062]MEE1656691.1 DUF4166 domain-containing protein [Microvirga sp. CF3062]
MKPCILVVGGAGAFGHRLVEGLLETTDATVIVAGRRPYRYADLIDTLRQLYGNDRIEAVALDRDQAFDTLQHLKPFCVVDAAGPFQNAHPHLAKAAIAAGCHYIDLADARDFVGCFKNLDAAAREAGVLAATGASSTPALSGAAVSALTDGWRQVDEIAIAISPGNRAPRGLSVVEAILAYAGQPVRIWLDGRWTTRPGWGELVKRDMPGLGPRWLSLCETPDLDLLPARYSSVRTVRFRAGLELSILHLGLWALTLPVRSGLIRSLRPCAAPLQKIASLFERLGTDRGGMSVDVSGVDANGCAVRATWSLVAEAGDGPNIPVLPALALLRGLLQGRVQAKGAKIASELLTLDVIEQEFGRFRIATRRDVRWPEADSLFERALGARVEVLPPIVRKVHTHAPMHLLGRASIDGARSWSTKLLARLFGFPAGTPDTAADISLKRHGHREIWIRRFGGSTFRSTFRAADVAGCIYERFGPFDFMLEVAPDPAGFTLTVVGWKLGPLRLPLRLAPQAPARAYADEEGRYRFDVAIALPWVGPLVRYQGWLEPDEA